MPSPWLKLAAFSLCSCTSAALWSTYSPIEALVSKYYDVTEAEVNMMSETYMVFYAFVPLTSFVFDGPGGLRRGVLCAAVGTFLGAGMRWVGSAHFPVVAAGQCVAALSQCFVLSTPPLLAERLFTGSDQPTATAIAALANQVGIAVGFGISGLLAPDLKLIHLVSAALTGVALLLCLWSFPPWGACGASDEEEEKSSLIVQVVADDEEEDEEPAVKRTPGWSHALRVAFRHRDFVLVLIGSSFVIGVFYALATIVGRLAEVGHFVKSAGGTLGVVMLLAGVPPSVLATRFAKTPGRLTDLCRASAVLSTGSAFYFVGACIRRSMPNAYLAAALFGLGIATFIPGSFEVAAAHSETSPPQYSGAALMGGSQVAGFLVTQAVTFSDLKDDFTMTGAFLVGASAFGLLCMLIAKKPAE